MEQTFKIEIVEKCWKDSLNWTFELIDTLNAVNNGKGKITDLEKSKDILRWAKEKNGVKKELISSQIEDIEFHVKPVSNFKSALKKLLNSTEIDFSKSMKIPPKPFGLFDSIDNQDLDESRLNGYLEKVKRNLEKNWIAFSQSYGRMLIKIKLNGYEIE